MSLSWACFNMYADTLEQLNKLNGALLGLMTKMKRDKHVELYFFNRYTNSEKKQFHIKFGLVNGDEIALSKLDDLAKELEVRKEPYDCEMWEVDGIPIDFIKCISCELFEKIRELTKGKPPTLDQLYFLLHFLMNQIGLGYENELKLYKSLEQAIEKQLKESAKQRGKS
jgi:hypothetical protein